MIKSFCKRWVLRWRRRWGRRTAENYSEIELIHAMLTREENTGRMMVDVGAQFGESFAPFHLFGWEVLAFEPDPDPRKQGALALRAGEGVRVVAKAVAAQEAQAVDFFASEVSTGISALAPFHASHRAVGKVEVSTLARELAEAGVKRVDFLKVDTEGHDFFVLQGFPWTRTELRPRVILCEFEDSKTRPLGYGWRNMADFLVARGYRVWVSEWYPIVRYGVKHRWRSLLPYERANVEEAGWGNLIALSSAEEVAFLEALGEKHKAS